MSIKKLSGAGLTTPKTNKLWDQTTFQSGMFALATITLSNSTTAAVTFSDIPTNYTSLQIRGIVRSASTGGSMRCDLNGDTNGSANYSRSVMYGDGSSFGNSAANADSVRLVVGDIATSASTTDVFSGFVANFPRYSNTSIFKSMRALNGFDNNGSGTIQYRTGCWGSASAINSIQFYMGDGSNFLIGSTFALYGLKG